MNGALYTVGERDEQESLLDLAATLLTSSSDGAAVIAYSLLRETAPAHELVALANLREIVLLFPAPPFCPPIGLDTLGFAEYEATGRSMRRLFESDHGLFGIEFVGSDQSCEGAVVHTSTSRFALYPDSSSTLDRTMYDVFVNHDLIFDVLAQAVSLLGLGCAERRYADVDAFPAAHAAAAAGEAFGELF